MGRDGNGTVNWGPVFADDLHRVTLPDDNWVDVKRYITEADEADALDAAKGRVQQTQTKGRRRKKGDEENSQFYFDSGSYRLKILQGVVKAWSFLTKDGKPIPVTPDTVGALPSHTRDFIMEAVDDLNPSSDEEGEDGDDQSLGSASSSSSATTEKEKKLPDSPMKSGAST